MVLGLPLPAVLSKDGLEHVATHKYVPGAYTPLDNILNPFWLKLSEMLPLWLAPNLVTLLGFMPMALCYALLWGNSPHFSEAPSRFLALFTAVGTYFYQTMDAVDGKQARRTGASTPLGQLFDHGCDCLACLSHHSVAAMVLLPGANYWTLAALAVLQTAFFFAQWQEYHTGVLSTSFGPVGVTETQFAVILCGVVGGLLGPERLEASVHSKISVPWLSEPTTAGIAVIHCWIFFVATLSSISFTKTFGHAYKEKKMDGVILAATQLIPMAMVNLVLFFVWDPSVVQLHPRNLCFVTGILFFFLTAQMILFSMAKMEFPIAQPTIAPYFLLALSSRFLPNAVMGPVLGLASIVLGSWVFLWLCRVMEELKAKLGIFAFKITPKKQN
eukprot:CAMPEP_0206460380 /NCGR_PEP_ID=MMETSP0324_2-20121206/24720_1 /ASSEMBLY_ACC=CAM_ASM_000836 /TAXON_ID=2866 /ORGANISM="Crypthecodinium cohnii, Strain Seligo" /LENGTH=385 /DNA_ID=CAMNT_0053932077 /DNA_START=12 /DNA_END=1169 /DNA_ORIENTATION=+